MASSTIMKLRRETRSAMVAPSGPATAMTMKRVAWKAPTAVAPPSWKAQTVTAVA